MKEIMSKEEKQVVIAAILMEYEGRNFPEGLSYEAFMETHANFLISLYDKHIPQSPSQSEAVEFAEWTSQGYTYVEKDKWDGDNDDTYTTSELYQLFLHNKKK